MASLFESYERRINRSLQNVRGDATDLLREC